MNRPKSVTQRGRPALGLSLLTGFALAIFIWYLLYRLTLPAKPFIYVAF